MGVPSKITASGKDNEGFVDDPHQNVEIHDFVNGNLASDGACSVKKQDDLEMNEVSLEVTRDDLDAFYQNEANMKENIRAVSTPSQDEEQDDSSNCRKTTKVVCKNILKTILVLLCLYFFICSLSLLSASFQILAGKTAGGLFTNESILSNPFTGLILGIMVTVLVQSSSTSTSIVVTMVGSGIISVHDAIFIIMGTNIGTSVTNTIVSLTQSMEREEFRKSFAGATVHDMFNLLAVVVMFPLEIATGYLEWLSNLIVSSMSFTATTDSGPRFIEVITEPVISHVIQINKTVLTLVAQDIPIPEDTSMVKKWCEQDYVCLDNATTNHTVEDCDDLITVGIRLCQSPQDFLFANTGMSDSLVGTLLLIVSLVMLCTCLILMVKILNSMLQGNVSIVIKKVINTNFKKPFGWVSGYLAMIVGALLTVLVQSSSVFTSTMTPLVGIGVITLERMYPLTLGSNIGTTSTSVLAAFATIGDNLKFALQISFCHLIFNITAIAVWYPVPFMRKIPVGAARTLGDTTAKYRWFAVLYLIFVFFLIPASLLALSIASRWALIAVVSFIGLIIIFAVVVNVLQRKKPNWLPQLLRSWDFLPMFMHSLKPYDKVITKYLACCKCCRDENFEPSDHSTTQPHVMTSFSKVNLENYFDNDSERSFAVTVSSANTKPTEGG